MNYPNRPPRYPTHIPVIVTQAGSPQTGYIVDINTHGACLSGIAKVAPDEVLHLRGAIETNVASIRWQDNNRVGVYFERPIPPQYLAMLRLRGTAYQVSPPMTDIRAASL